MVSSEHGNGNGHGKRGNPSWQKGGESPNPSGRPKGVLAEIREALGEYGPKALRRLAELAGLVEGVAAAESQKDQILCLNAVADRLYGRPSQAITGADGGPIQFEATPTTGPEAVARLRERGLPAPAAVN